MSERVTNPSAHIEGVPGGAQTIMGVATSITAFMGTALCGPLGYDTSTDKANPTAIFSFADYQRIFGGLSADSPMSYAVRDFFLNGGSQAIIVRLYEADGQQYPNADTYTDAGTKALDSVDLFNLLCVPYDTSADYAEQAEQQAMDAYARLAQYCRQRRAMLIVDPPMKWTTDAKNDKWSTIQPTDVNINGDVERNAAVYFPRVVEADPLLKGAQRVMPACGIIAGVMASTDATRGVWKAPAGVDAGLNGILGLELNMTDVQNSLLNPLGINCLRSFPTVGPVVWGARTLRGADLFEDDYKYINVRRLALYIEESLNRGTEWASVEPNDETLWASLRLSVDTFLADLQRQGAFYSYFVNCDSTTTTPDDIAQGIVNIIVGIAPVEPAEFIVIQIQQVAGQTS